MSYYYDIIVNFQDENWMFYEWDDKDSLDVIKKIPAFQVPVKVLKDMVNYNVQVTKEFLEKIKDKTKLNKGVIEYAVLLVSKNGAIVLEFAGDGKSIARSYLQVVDECHILDTSYILPMEKLDYTLLNKLEYHKTLRSDTTIKDVINLEINTLYQNKKWEKIVFLYNEWFKKSKHNVAEMVQDMQNKLQGEVTGAEVNVYNLIKLSYNNV